MSDPRQDFDYLVVGAGPVGSVAARLCADRGYKVLILDRRPHVAGNCYDEKDTHGILIHKYGPHYFRTNDDNLLQFLSRFTEWIPGQYVVKSQVKNVLYPFPINLTTLEMYFNRQLTPEQAKELLESQRQHFHHPPRNSEEFVLSRVGENLYRDFYYGYTLKQWEKEPAELDPSVCGRIPVRLNRIETYVDHKYQVLPKNGFTQMFENMLAHPNIEIHKNIDFKDIKDQWKPRKATLYTGAIDEYFNYQFGRLPWRSLCFEFKNLHQEYYQPCVQVNYPSLEVEFTRIVEIKHATGQKAPSTTISIEYPTSVGDPYYPIPSAEGQKLYTKYKALADSEEQSKNVFFAGRLAQYTYINTDQAIEIGFKIAEKMLQAQEGKK